MASYLITGAGRGLGLEFVKQLTERPPHEVSTVFASVRRPSEGLQQLVDQRPGRITVVDLNIIDRDSIVTAVNQVNQHLHGKGLDVLINNAAIMEASLEGVASMDNLRRALEVNVEAVHNVTVAFLPLLRKGLQKKVLNMSSDVCSMTSARRFIIMPYPSYKISKVALNALTVQWALDLEKEGFAFVAVSPGWVRTDMGGRDIADLDVSTAAKAVLDVLSRPGPKINGKFLNIRVDGWEHAEGIHQYDGADLPW